MLSLVSLIVLTQVNKALLDTLVPKGTHPVLIASGMQFTEGPVWAPEGYLIWSDILADTIYKLQIDKPIPYAKPSHRAIGNTFDAQKRRISCLQASRSVIRLETDGKETVLADRYQGKRFNAPDDVIARSDGNIYFSDPSFALKPQEKELAFDGVYRISQDGTISVVSQTLAKPNGLAFSPDEKTLYVNDTVRQQIFAYDVGADGTPSHERLFAYVTGELPGQPNGLKVDRLGNVYCTGPGGIQIFSPAGKYIGFIYMATVVSNFCFGGKDYKSLFITSGTSVFELKMKVAGMPTSSALTHLK